jgi:hypothetical protein
MQSVRSVWFQARGRASRTVPLHVRVGWLMLLLIFAGTGYIALSVVIRAQVYDVGTPLTNDEQFKALWTFIAAGLTASASLAAALFSDARQQEASKRQTLEAVSESLKLISEPGACPQAVSGGALATITYLGHPTIAMRALTGASDARAVDRDTTVWLLGWVLTGRLTTGTRAERASAREEAAALLRSMARGSGLTYHDYRGSFAWPSAFHNEWAPGLSPSMNLNILRALAWLLVSESREWWGHPLGTEWFCKTADIAKGQKATLDSNEAMAICEAISDVVRFGRITRLADLQRHLDEALVESLCKWPEAVGKIAESASAVGYDGTRSQWCRHPWWRWLMSQRPLAVYAAVRREARPTPEPGRTEQTEHPAHPSAATDIESRGVK